MFLIIGNALLFAALLVIIVAPALHINNLSHVHEDTYNPPDAGERIAGRSVPHATLQKLYLLFVIPTCTVINSAFLYFAYYRPIRFVQYRVEVNVVSLRRLRQKSALRLAFVTDPSAQSGYVTRHNSSLILSHIAPNVSVGPASASLQARMRGGGAGGAADEHSRAERHNRIKLHTHSRPKAIKKNEYAVVPTFPELAQLYAQIERNFFTDCTVAEKNFCIAYERAFGVGEEGNGVGVANAVGASAMSSFRSPLQPSAGSRRPFFGVNNDGFSQATRSQAAQPPRLEALRFGPLRRKAPIPTRVTADELVPLAISSPPLAIVGHDSHSHIAGSPSLTGLRPVMSGGVGASSTVATAAAPMIGGGNNYNSTNNNTGNNNIMGRVGGSVRFREEADKEPFASELTRRDVVRNDVVTNTQGTSMGGSAAAAAAAGGGGVDAVDLSRVEEGLYRAGDNASMVLLLPSHEVEHRRAPHSGHHAQNAPTEAQNNNANSAGNEHHSHSLPLISRLTHSMHVVAKEPID